ncbi:dTMP kinase [Candidatus Calescamantes bacterium]|nr:dTMP kinase [Candidatus Calescamantes bacterium]
MKTGYLLSIEGTEGCGKSTVAEGLKKYFEEREFAVSLYREPGGTEVGERIRSILLHFDVTPLSEALLYFAARGELIDKRVIPDLQQGKIVILDRFIDSTLAYQGYGRGLNLDWIKKMNDEVTQGVKPNLTLLLLSSSLLGFLKEGRDRIEKEEISFHRKVREGYLEIARSEPERIRVVEVEWGKDIVLRKVLDILEREVLPCLSRK